MTSQPAKCLRSAVPFAASIVAVVAAVLFISSLSADAEILPNVLCGDEIDQDTTLQADVGPCEGDGLVITADGVELDLNGYDIFGLDDLPQTSGSGAGVLIDGHADVTVTDNDGGSEVRWFDAGVVIVDGEHNTVQRLHILKNIGEVSHLGGLTSGEWGEGIGLWEADHNTIQDNVVEDNGPWAGIGLYGDLQANGSDYNTLRNNEIIDNNFRPDPVFANQNIGIRIEPYSSRNDLVRNTVANSGLDGIAFFFGASHNQVQDNEIQGNPRDGVRVWGVDPGANENTVSDNEVCGNDRHGISVDENATDNTIEANQSGDGQDGCTPNAAVDLHDDHGHCNANTWQDNTYTSKDPACIS